MSNEDQKDAALRIQALWRGSRERQQHKAKLNARRKARLRAEARARNRRRTRQRNIAFNQNQLLLLKSIPVDKLSDVLRFQQQRSARRIQKLARQFLKNKQNASVHQEESATKDTNNNTSHSRNTLIENQQKVPKVEEKIPTTDITFIEPDRADLLRGVDVIGENTESDVQDLYKKLMSITQNRASSVDDDHHDANAIHVDPMQLADLQTSISSTAQATERNWYLQQISASSGTFLPANTPSFSPNANRNLSTNKRQLGQVPVTRDSSGTYRVATALSVKHARIKELRGDIYNIIHDHFMNGFGIASTHLTRTETARSINQLLRRLTRMPADLEQVASLLLKTLENKSIDSDESKQLSSEKPKSKASSERLTLTSILNASFPLPQNEELVQAARRAHTSTLEALHESKPWWRYCANGKRVDMRSVKCGLPAKELLGDMYLTAGTGASRSNRVMYDEQSGHINSAKVGENKELYRRLRYIKHAYEKPCILSAPPVTLTKASSDPETHTYSDKIASDLWFSYVCGSVIGVAPQFRSNGLKSTRSNAQENLNQRLSDHTTALESAKQKRLASGVFDDPLIADFSHEDTSIHEYEDTDLLAFHQISLAMQKLDVVDPWASRSSGGPNWDSADTKMISQHTPHAERQALSRRADEALAVAVSKTTAANQLLEESEKPFTSDNDEIKRNTLEDQVAVAVAAMENPAFASTFNPDKGSGTTNASWSSLYAPHWSLASSQSSIEERIRHCTDALRRAEAARDHRLHRGFLDRHVAARRIQKCFRASQAKNLARKEQARFAEARERQRRKVQEARFQQVYGQLSGLLRQMVAEATGINPDDTKLLGGESSDALEALAHKTRNQVKSLRLHAPSAVIEDKHAYTRTRKPAHVTISEPNVSTIRSQKDFEGTNTTVRSSIGDGSLIDTWKSLHLESQNSARPSVSIQREPRKSTLHAPELDSTMDTSAISGVGEFKTLDGKLPASRPYPKMTQVRIPMFSDDSHDSVSFSSMNVDRSKHQNGTISSIEDSTAATLKSSFGDYATPSRGRINVPQYFNPEAADQLRHVSGTQPQFKSEVTTNTFSTRAHTVLTSPTPLSSVEDSINISPPLNNFRNIQTTGSNRTKQNKEPLHQSPNPSPAERLFLNEMGLNDSQMELSSTFDVSAPADLSLTHDESKQEQPHSPSVRPSTAPVSAQIESQNMEPILHQRPYSMASDRVGKYAAQHMRPDYTDVKTAPSQPRFSWMPHTELPTASTMIQRNRALNDETLLPIRSNVTSTVSPLHTMQPQFAVQTPYERTPSARFASHAHETVSTASYISSYAPHGTGKSEQRERYHSYTEPDTQNIYSTSFRSNSEIQSSKPRAPFFFQKSAPESDSSSQPTGWFASQGHSSMAPISSQYSTHEYSRGLHAPENFDRNRGMPSHFTAPRSFINSDFGPAMINYSTNRATTPAYLPQKRQDLPTDSAAYRGTQSYPVNHLPSSTMYASHSSTLQPDSYKYHIPDLPMNRPSYSRIGHRQ